MSEKSSNLIEDIKENLSFAIDAALEGDYATGYILCENSVGVPILVDKSTAAKADDLQLKCRNSRLKPKATIIIAPKK